jgi:hypothetical protein
MHPPFADNMKFSAVLIVLATAVAANAHTISAYSGTEKTGTKFSTTGTGSFNLNFKAKSYVWSPSGGSVFFYLAEGGKQHTDCMRVVAASSFATVVPRLATGAGPTQT